MTVRASITRACIFTATSVAVSEGASGACASAVEAVSKADKQKDERAACVVIVSGFRKSKRYWAALFRIIVRLSFERAETTTSFEVIATIM